MSTAAAPAAPPSPVDVPDRRGAARTGPASEPPVLTLPKHNWTTGAPEDMPVDLGVAREVLTFLFGAQHFLDDPDLLRRRIKLWRERIYLTGWEDRARELRTENAAAWTYSRIARELGVSKALVEALFRPAGVAISPEGAP